MFFHHGIAPHFLKIIKFSCLRKHHMHYNVHIIHNYPMQMLMTFLVKDVLQTVFLYFFFNIIRNCPYLRTTGGFTDNKKICHRFWYFSQVE
jgi:hypothetical protein